MANGFRADQGVGFSRHNDGRSLPCLLVDPATV